MRTLRLLSRPDGFPVVAYCPYDRSGRHFCACRPLPGLVPSAFARQPRQPEAVSIAVVAD